MRLKSIVILWLASGCGSVARDAGVVCIPATDPGEDLVVTYSQTCVSSSDTVLNISCVASGTDSGIKVRGKTRIRRMFGGGDDDCNVVSSTCTVEGGTSEGDWDVEYADIEATIEVPVTERLCIDAERGEIEPDAEPDLARRNGCGC